MKFFSNIILLAVTLAAIPFLTVIGLISILFGSKKTPVQDFQQKQRTEHDEINPESGLPMVGNSGVDIHGNPYGTTDNEL